MKKKTVLRRLLQVMAICLVFVVAASVALPNVSARAIYLDDQTQTTDITLGRYSGYDELPTYDPTYEPTTGVITEAPTEEPTEEPSDEDYSGEKEGPGDAADVDYYNPVPYYVYEEMNESGDVIYKAETFLPIVTHEDNASTYDMGYWLLDQMCNKLDQSEFELKSIVLDLAGLAPDTESFSVKFPAEAAESFPSESKSIEMLLPGIGTLVLPAQSFDTAITEIVITLTEEGLVVDSFNGEEALTGITYELIPEEGVSCELILPAVEEEPAAEEPAAEEPAAEEPAAEEPAAEEPAAEEPAAEEPAAEEPATEEPATEGAAA